MNRDELLLKILDNFNSSSNILTRDLIMLFEDTPKEDKKIEKLDISGLTSAEAIIKNTRKLNEIIDRLNSEDNE